MKHAKKAEESTQLHRLDMLIKSPSRYLCAPANLFNDINWKAAILGGSSPNFPSNTSQPWLTNHK